MREITDLLDKALISIAIFVVCLLGGVLFAVGVVWLDIMIFDAVHGK